MESDYGSRFMERPALDRARTILYHFDMSITDAKLETVFHIPECIEDAEIAFTELFETIEIKYKEFQSVFARCVPEAKDAAFRQEIKSSFQATLFNHAHLKQKFAKTLPIQKPETQQAFQALVVDFDKDRFLENFMTGQPFTYDVAAYVKPSVPDQHRWFRLRNIPKMRNESPCHVPLLTLPIEFRHGLYKLTSDNDDFTTRAAESTTFLGQVYKKLRRNYGGKQRFVANEIPVGTLPPPLTSEQNDEVRRAIDKMREELTEIFTKIQSNMGRQWERIAPATLVEIEFIKNIDSQKLIDTFMAGKEYFPEFPEKQ